MPEKTRLVVFSDSHQAPKRAVKSVEKIAREVKADGVVFAGDHDRCAGFEAMEGFVDVAILGNHCYCWANLAEGRVRNVPPEYQGLANDRKWKEPPEKMLALFSRFQVQHLFERIHIRHALSPFIVGNDGPDDDEFSLDWGRDFLPSKYLGERFWATPSSDTMFNGTPDRNAVLGKVFDYMKEEDQRLLITGHDHRTAAVEFLNGSETVTESELTRGTTYENIPEGSRLRLPAFFKQREVIVLDIWAERVDATLLQTQL